MFESPFNILNKTTFKQKALISCFIEYDKSIFSAREPNWTEHLLHVII